MAEYSDSHIDDSSPNDAEDPGLGHYFTKKSFHRPTYCHHCTEMLWGLRGQGYVCEVCTFVVHDRCLKNVTSPCSSIAAQLIKFPVAHCWSEPGHFKRKFCNLCRKRLEESSLAIRCDICEYYAHIDCQDFVVSDCKECATFVPAKEKATSAQYHHWREGNLPGNSKCLQCKRTCWSAECLAGMRCEWCGVTAHAGCYKLLPVECSFGCLREIMLPPHSVTVPRMDASIDSMYGFQKKPVLPVAEDFSSSGDSKTEEEDKRSPKEKEGKEKDKDREDEIVRIFDGNTSLKRRVYRSVAVPKNSPAQVLLEAALRTFHISDEPKNYYLAETSEKESGERRIDLTVPIRTQLSSRDGKRPSVFLRYQDPNPDKGYIRVYPGPVIKGNLQSRPSVVPYKHIPVTADTTVQQVLECSLNKFGIMEDIDGQNENENENSTNVEPGHNPANENSPNIDRLRIEDQTVDQPQMNADPNKFSLVEVSLDKGVSEREMERDEKPWLVIQQAKKKKVPTATLR